MKFSKFFLLLSVVFTGCVSGGQVFNDGYPDAWWAPVTDQLPAWEIPPQAANRSLGQVVLSKRNELGQFSNLQAAPFQLDGENYASVEALWQSLKYPEDKNDVRLKNPAVKWQFTREQVKKMSGFESKKAGDAANENMKKLGITWVTYNGKKIEYKGQDQQTHYELILRASRAKLQANPQLSELLLKTGNLSFLPDHKLDADAPPAYKYNEIYMKLRGELSHP